MLITIYYKKMRQQKVHQTAQKLFLFFGILLFGLNYISAQTEPKRTISADYSQVKGKTNRFYREVVGAGRLAEALRAD